jgi:uncharacterized protein (DUF885 family)
MLRRQFLRGGSALVALASAGAVRAAPAAGSEDARLRALLDAFWEEDLDASPEMATAFGVDTGQRAGQRAKLSDQSRAARIRWGAEHKARLARLAMIDESKLSAASKVDRKVVAYAYDRIATDSGKYRFGEGPAGFSYAPYSPYVVSQLSGAYQSVPDFLDSNHPVKTKDDAEAYLARLEAFPKALDDNTAALKEDAAAGVLPPDFALEATLAQMSRMLAVAPGDSGLTTSLAGRAKAAGVAGDWAARAAAIVRDKVYPALARQIAAVEALKATASHDAGVWKLPNGDAFYADALAFQTTVDRSPADTHELGLAQVAELNARIDLLLKAQGLTTGSVGERLTALSKRPDQLWPNTDAGRADLIKSLNEQTEAIRAKMPLAFRTLPPTPVEIVRVPPEIQDGAPNGYATPPTLDGSRPGRFYINLKDTAEWPKFTLPTLTYHEALPGHQWEGAISMMSTDTPMLRRVGLGFAAYGEGWALYAEQLADELGSYDGDPLGKIGFLQSLQFRAVRIVVDTGMHARRWSREKATDYMVEMTGMPRTRVQREIDRYCIWPGQACSYKIGHTEWVRVREAAKARAGATFDIKAFHDVLRNGAMPLVVLDQVVKGMFP